MQHADKEGILMVSTAVICGGLVIGMLWALSLNEQRASDRNNAASNIHIAAAQQACRDEGGVSRWNADDPDSSSFSFYCEQEDRLISAARINHAGVVYVYGERSNRSG